MAPRKGGIRRTLLSLLLILPLIAGAAYLGWAGIGPSAAWTADGAEEGRAPGPVPGIDVGQVQDARRAIGEAGTQAGFLNAGMGQATEGIGELKDGGTELVDGTGQVRKGAADLATGMTELQAGTGRLGAGAKEIAAGAGTIADNVGLVNVAVGQVEAALGPAKEALRASGDPNAGDAVADLEALERQLATVDFDAIAGEAERFRRGADDMSYQLNTPGAPYRDGIYNATAGAAALRTGTEELDEGAKKLDGGLRELDEGAGRLDGMAQTTVDKIGDAQRAMPVPTGDQLAAAGLAGDAGDGGEGAAAGSNATLAPTLAFMVSALVMLAASALWLIDGPRRRGRGVVGASPDSDADVGADASAAGWWGRVLPGGAFAGALAGIVAIGALVLFIMADGMDLLRGATSVIVLALAALAATALSRAVKVVFGPAWGRAVILAGLLVQVGVIGWVWRTAATAASGGTELATAWGVAAALLPLHHPTAALTTLGNAGSTVMWGTSAGALLALVVIGALIDRFGGGRRRAAAAATTSPEPATTKSPTPTEAETATPGDDGATTGDARNDAGDPADGDEGGVVKRNEP
ncbi:hypothetical protein CJ204_08530 [Corynebacterium xerosis]|uniref:X-X-X-Leu-X-X-Gly heptad repeat-containing protein n=1 Tax=Corynebacterium xerosis TaxID=1725 RepID=A0A2N6SXR9_9CORY|nr:hypothetical protein [Corynebacterium xerosis]PMC61865.1 hypothetical protein CJ204_08530 [Corynebacterium xerosis]